MARDRKLADKRLGLSPIVDNETRRIGAARIGDNIRIQGIDNASAEGLAQTLRSFNATAQAGVGVYQAEKEKAAKEAEAAQKAADKDAYKADYARGLKDAALGQINPEDKSEGYVFAGLEMKYTADLYDFQKGLIEEYNELFDGDSEPAEIDAWLSARFQEQYQGIETEAPELVEKVIKQLAGIRREFSANHFDRFTKEQEEKRLADSIGVFNGEYETFGDVDYKGHMKNLKEQGFDDQKVISHLYSATVAKAIAEGDPNLFDKLPEEIRNDPKVNSQLARDRATAESVFTRKQNEAYMDLFRRNLDQAEGGKFTEQEIEGLNLPVELELKLKDINTKARDKFTAVNLQIGDWLASAQSEGRIRLMHDKGGKDTAEAGYQAYRETLKNNGYSPEQIEVAVADGISSTGLLPKSYVHETDAMVRSNDPEQRVLGMMRVNRLLSSNSDFAADLKREAPTAYVAATLYRAGADDDRIFSVMENMRQSTPAEYEALDAVSSKHTSGINSDADKVIDAWIEDTYTPEDWGAEAPAIPFRLASDYKEALKVNYRLTKDMDAAHKLTQTDMASLWNRTHGDDPDGIVGSGRMMRLPPESFNYGVPHNNWIPEDFNAFTSTVEKPEGFSRFTYVTDFQTEMARGQQRDWGLHWVDEYGSVHPVINNEGRMVRYKPDPKRYLESLNRVPEAAREEKQEWIKKKQLWDDPRANQIF